MNIVDDDITIRAIEQSDALMLRNMVNDAETEQFVVGWSFPVSSVAQLEWITNLVQANEPKFIIEIGGLPVGMTGISELDFKNSTAVIDIKISSSENRGVGLGNRVYALMIKYCFEELNLNCLHGTALSYNIASHKMMEKNGYKKDGILRARVYKKGEYHDLVSYSLLREEYLKNTGY